MKSFFLLCFVILLILLNCKPVLAENYFFEDSLINKRNIILKAKRDNFFIGGGFVYNSTSNNHRFKNGYNITFNYLYIVSPTLGARIDLDFIHSGRKEYSYNQSDFAGVTRIYKYYGGDAKSYLLTMRLLLGSLNPDDLAQFYFLPGLGVGVTNTTAQYDTYMAGSILYPIYPYSDEDHRSLSLGISAGLGMNIKVLNYLRFFTEAQFNYWYLASDASTGFGVVKIGVIL